MNFGEIPTVCGGEKYGYHFPNCWSFKGGNWLQTYSTHWPILYYAMSKSPFKNASQSLFIAGGSLSPDQSQVIKYFFWGTFMENGLIDLSSLYQSPVDELERNTFGSIFFKFYLSQIKFL